MSSGELTVTGINSTRIPLNGFPRRVHVHFEKEHERHHCGHHHDDDLSHRIEHIDENPHHHHDIIHEHHDRKFFLVIEWDVSGVRDIFWSVSY